MRNDSIQFFISYGTINRGKSCILTPPITTFNFVQLPHEHRDMYQ